MKSSPNLGRKTLIVFTLTLVSFATAWASTQKVLYSFTGGTDGGVPDQSHTLVFDKTGNLYGTTSAGGLYGQGTVFELSPTPSGWTETVLYSFTGGADGAYPWGGVVIDAAGNLYGSTFSGGDAWCHCGIVFQLTPSEGGWTQTVLYTFTGDFDGGRPNGLVLVGDGQLFGSAQFGGPKGWGIIFELWRSESSWSFGIYNYFKGSDGRWPEATLAALGNSLFGTTSAAGNFSNGNVFWSWGPGKWGIENLHSFNSKGAPGNHPDSTVAVVPDDGVFIVYGTTLYGGKCGSCGTVFELNWAWGNGTKPGLKVLHAFLGPDGEMPRGLILDKTGSLYGLTQAGGPSLNGTVFKLTPGGPKNKWIHTVLHAFTGVDGSSPVGTLIQDTAGNLYGTTAHGGDNDQGVVFEIIP